MIVFDIISLFPESFQGVFDYGVLGKAREEGLIEINVHDLRPYGAGRHRVLDDAPYGGGDGMVMMAEPVAKALEGVVGADRTRSKVILTTPQGKLFNQEKAVKLAGESRLVIICGRYAGVDERVRAEVVDEEISIGDYILTGGHLAAMVIVDAVARLAPGVLGNKDSAANDSFPLLLEEAQYTRPREWRGLEAPDVLISGDHARIERWRAIERLRRTARRRPDLYEKAVESLRRMEEQSPERGGGKDKKSSGKKE